MYSADVTISGVGSRDGEHFIETPHPRGDRHHEANACALRARKHGLSLFGEIGKVEMAVAIDQHHGKMKGPCSSSL